jgi:hypothetical protein
MWCKPVRFIGLVFVFQDKEKAISLGMASG